jgi:hypothetical protein
LSIRAQAVIADLERRHYRVGATFEALRRWMKFARSKPGHRVVIGCGIPGCCPTPGEDRELLQAVLHALPTRDARELRRRLAPLDERIEPWELA